MHEPEMNVEEAAVPSAPPVSYSEAEGTTTQKLDIDQFGECWEPNYSHKRNLSSSY